MVVGRGRDGPYGPPPAQIPACGFPAPGSCRRSNATKVESLDGPAASVRRLAASGTCRFRLCVRGMRRGSPSLRPAAFPPPSPPPIHDRLCSRLPRYYAAVRLLRPACAASPDRASHPGPRPPTWSWAARGLPGSDVFRSSVMWSSTPAERRRLAWAAPHMLPSAFPTASASARSGFSELNTHPTGLLCTLRHRRRRRPRNTRYRATRYRLTRAGLPPAGPRQLRLAH